MTTKESRRDPRSRALNLTVRYKSATVADFVEDHSHDISRGGLFIKTANPFATGTLLKFEVRIVGEKTVIDGVGRVAWRREKSVGPNKPAGMGVKFIRIDDTSVHLIEQAVSRHSNADSQFEEGAREQGITLSQPPPNLRAQASSSSVDKRSDNDAESAPPRAPMFPAHDPRDPQPEDASEQSMLFQTSELLKSALNKVNPEASVEAGISQPEIRAAETPDYGDVTAEDRATLPTGSSKIPPPAVKVVSTSSKVEVRDDEGDDDDDITDETDDTDDASSDRPPPVGDEAGERRRSKRPGANKRKNPKKKKRKFSYASLPAPKQNKSALSTTPPADLSSSTSPAKHRSEFPATAPVTNTNGSSFWWVATLALVAISGALYLAFSSPEPTVTRPDDTTAKPSRDESAAVERALVPAEGVATVSVATDTLAVATTLVTSATSPTDSSDTGSPSSSASSDSSSNVGSAVPLSASANASSGPSNAEDPSQNEKATKPTRSRSRRRVPRDVAPDPVAKPPVVPSPAAPVVPTPVLPTVVAPVAPQTPVVPTPTAPTTPQAPAPVAPQAPAPSSQGPRSAAVSPPATSPATVVRSPASAQPIAPPTQPAPTPAQPTPAAAPKAATPVPVSPPPLP
jgi:uncharacterized protein (TIGR02266 family)